MSKVIYDLEYVDLFFAAVCLLDAMTVVAAPMHILHPDVNSFYCFIKIFFCQVRRLSITKLLLLDHPVLGTALYVVGTW